MAFLVLSAFSGLVLAFGPVYLARRLRQQWNIRKGLFFQAGLALLLLELFHYSVLDSALSHWPQFLEMDIVWQAIILGVATGLFFELGRFFVLDKIFRSVRKLREGLFFGLGWNGVETVLFGLLLIIGSFGIYLLATTPDVSTLFPDATTAQLQEARLYQEQSFELLQTFPLYGLSWILERGALLLLDLAATLMILLRFAEGDNRYVWLAVLTRTVFVGITFSARQMDPLAAILAAAVLGGALYFVMTKLRARFSARLQ